MTLIGALPWELVTLANVRLPSEFTWKTVTWSLPCVDGEEPVAVARQGYRALGLQWPAPVPLPWVE